MSPTFRTAIAALPIALLLGACGNGEPAASPGPLPHERAGSTATPGPTVSATPRKDEPVRAPSPDPEQQATLDERLRDAAWDNDVPLARRLVAKGADVNAKDETEQSAYLIATSEGHLDLLRLTLKNGARVDDKDSWNGTGLIRAAERGHGLVVGELLRAGIDRDHVNRIGYQAIHEAIWLGEDTPAYATTVRCWRRAAYSSTTPRHPRD